MATQQGKPLRLVEHLVFVGPEQKDDETVASYCDVSQATLLRQFPEECHSDGCISIKEAACFCQPHGVRSPKDFENKHHTFMLTDTETNKSLYGICYTFPYEITTVRSHDPTAVAKETVLLSVCLLSQHFFLNFFQSCLEALVKLVEECCEQVTWMDLFYPKPDNTMANASSTVLMCDIENWINKLLGLKLPVVPGDVLEVMVNFGPPLTLSHPLPNELPLGDLSPRQLFQHLQPHTVNEILRLILNEQKVVICSKRHEVVPKIVLTLVSLLYPLQYVYPMIPLLPARLKQAADFLMVPVPYIIGTTTDLIAELAPSNLEDVYVVDIDTKEIKIPQLTECLPGLPVNSLELQANIKKILDSIQPCMHVEGSMVVVGYQDVDYINALIRWTFLDFMMSPQMLGLLLQHQTIVRLFPRSVVKLRSSCLLQAYNQSLQRENTNFIKKFMTSQSVGYFLDWNLNPTNITYLQSASVVGKGLLNCQACVNDNRERVEVSLLDCDSRLYQLLLQHSVTVAKDNCTDSSSEEDEHEHSLSSWNCQHLPNLAMPAMKLSKPMIITPKAKISDHYQTCQQWVEKLLEGKGILYMKTPHKQALLCDSSRSELLLLVERSLLGCCETSEVLHNTTPLEVNCAVFGQLLLLTKLMLKNINKEFSKNPDGYLSSAFILLHLSCLVCLNTIPLASKKPSSDEVTMLKSPVLPCGDNFTPIVSSVSSYTSSSDDDEMENDLSDEVMSSTSGTNNKLHVNKKFLCHDLFMKSPSRFACLAKDDFWKTVYLSTVDMLRTKFGWNEKTPELYQRYLSVGNSGQREMGEEEDKLLTLVLINLSTFMNIAGVSADKRKQLITNLMMYCRLCQHSDKITSTLEERLCGKDIGLFPLYVKKLVTFTAHLGRNKSATFCKVEVWEDVLILRRMSDNDIILRFWRDDIRTSSCDTNNDLVVLYYKEDRQPPILLHTEQFLQLHETIITQ